MLDPRPTSKLEDHPLSTVHDCLFNVFAANLHNWRPSLYLWPEDAPCCGDRGPPYTDEVKDSFYEELERVFDKFPK
jgi:hypothetical protein